MSFVDSMVSVIMPTYNSGRFIAESIESVICQTYNNWELIIVDDASTDNTKAIVAEYIRKYSSIKYIFIEENSGAAFARTKAISMAQGEYIAFLDSDDIWYPDKLEKQFLFMRQNQYAFTATSYKHINEHGDDLHKIIKAIPKTDYKRLLLDCPVGNSSVMYNQKSMGKFTVPNIRKRNDDALWLKMLKKEKYIYGFDDVLMKYRIRKNSISSNKLKVIKYHWVLYRNIEHLSFLRSIFHIFYWCCIKILKIK